jgi:hypothetical protein
MSVISLFVLALSSMKRLEERDPDRGVSEAARMARLCLVASYVVRRVRARNRQDAPVGVSKSIQPVEGRFR